MAERIHRALSSDGTEIAGHVQGEGPPLVLVHGGLGDGDIAWLFVLPHLVDHFTCYLMNTRGRLLSADRPDHSRERYFEDVAAFVGAVGEPVGLAGHSSGAVWALGGAALAGGSVRGLALYEPPLPVTRPVMSDDAHAAATAAVASGRLYDAARLTADAIGLGPDEQEFFLMPAVFERVEGYLPIMLREVPEVNRPLDGSILGSINTPVLLFDGTRSGDHFRAVTHHLAERLEDARVVEIDAGHMGPVTAAEAVAKELVVFFGT